ncbi:MAG: hypothetical protein ACXV2G_02845 [Actinomycetes bacterium]
MSSRRSTAFGLAAVAAVAALGALTACGGQSSTTTSTGQSRQTAPGSTRSPDGAALEVVRTGGFAGVRDTLEVDARGRARVTTRDGRGRDCRPPGAALARLRALDLTAVAAAPTAAPRVADGFTYTVRIGARRASAGEGDQDGRRAALVAAAAAVLTSCLDGT